MLAKLSNQLPLRLADKDKLPNRSNSPFRTPPTKASHSPGVN